MKRKRFTEEQSIGVLKESEAGAQTDDICRRHGISSGLSDVSAYGSK
ncbi:transposase [Primorskyibacter sedentarius]|uniref:Transposase n=1 Tax=Primorskyibacter sedentarius TaxID=745311 RepID=A0A4R3IQF0_9RHOB|nr:transposase [Primorskyibacter sedentarius]